MLWASRSVKLQILHHQIPGNIFVTYAYLNHFRTADVCNTAFTIRFWFFTAMRTQAKITSNFPLFMQSQPSFFLYFFELAHLSQRNSCLYPISQYWLRIKAFTVHVLYTNTTQSNMSPKDVNRIIKGSRNDRDIEDQGDKINLTARSNNELVPNAGKIFLGKSALFWFLTIQFYLAPFHIIN